MQWILRNSFSAGLRSSFQGYLRIHLVSAKTRDDQGMMRVMHLERTSVTDNEGSVTCPQLTDAQ